MNAKEAADFGVKHFGKDRMVSKVMREKIETQRLIDREMRYSAEMRNVDLISSYNAHIQHLDNILAMVAH